MSSNVSVAKRARLIEARGHRLGGNHASNSSHPFNRTLARPSAAVNMPSTGKDTPGLQQKVRKETSGKSLTLIPLIQEKGEQPLPSKQTESELTSTMKSGNLYIKRDYLSNRREIGRRAYGARGAASTATKSPMHDKNNVEEASPSKIVETRAVDWPDSNHVDDERETESTHSRPSSPFHDENRAPRESPMRRRARLHAMRSRSPVGRQSALPVASPTSKKGNPVLPAPSSASPVQVQTSTTVSSPLDGLLSASRISSPNRINSLRSRSPTAKFRHQIRARSRSPANRILHSSSSTETLTKQKSSSDITSTELKSDSKEDSSGTALADGEKEVEASSGSTTTDAQNESHEAPDIFFGELTNSKGSVIPPSLSSFDEHERKEDAENEKSHSPETNESEGPSNSEVFSNGSEVNLCSKLTRASRLRNMKQSDNSAVNKNLNIDLRRNLDAASVVIEDEKESSVGSSASDRSCLSTQELGTIARRAMKMSNTQQGSRISRLQSTPLHHMAKKKANHGRKTMVNTDNDASEGKVELNSKRESSHGASSKDEKLQAGEQSEDSINSHQLPGKTKMSEQEKESAPKAPQSRLSQRLRAGKVYARHHHQSSNKTGEVETSELPCQSPGIHPIFGYSQASKIPRKQAETVPKKKQQDGLNDDSESSLLTKTESLPGKIGEEQNKDCELNDESESSRSRRPFYRSALASAYHRSYRNRNDQLNDDSESSKLTTPETLQKKNQEELNQNLNEESESSRTSKPNVRPVMVTAYHRSFKDRRLKMRAHSPAGVDEHLTAANPVADKSNVTSDSLHSRKAAAPNPCVSMAQRGSRKERLALLSTNQSAKQVHVTAENHNEGNGTKSCDPTTSNERKQIKPIGFRAARANAIKARRQFRGLAAGKAIEGNEAKDTPDMVDKELATAPPKAFPNQNILDSDRRYPVDFSHSSAVEMHRNVAPAGHSALHDEKAFVTISDDNCTSSKSTMSEEEFSQETTTKTEEIQHDDETGLEDEEIQALEISGHASGYKDAETHNYESISGIKNEVNDENEEIYCSSGSEDEESDDRRDLNSREDTSEDKAMNSTEDRRDDIEYGEDMLQRNNYLSNIETENEIKSNDSEKKEVTHVLRENYSSESKSEKEYHSQNILSSSQRAYGKVDVPSLEKSVSTPSNIKCETPREEQFFFDDNAPSVNSSVYDGMDTDSDISPSLLAGNPMEKGEKAEFSDPSSEANQATAYDGTSDFEQSTLFGEALESGGSAEEESSLNSPKSSSGDIRDAFNGRANSAAAEPQLDVLPQSEPEKLPFDQLRGTTGASLPVEPLRTQSSHERSFNNPELPVEQMGTAAPGATSSEQCPSGEKVAPSGIAALPSCDEDSSIFSRSAISKVSFSSSSASVHKSQAEVPSKEKVGQVPNLTDKDTGKAHAINGSDPSSSQPTFERFEANTDPVAISAPHTSTQHTSTLVDGDDDDEDVFSGLDDYDNEVSPMYGYRHQRFPSNRRTYQEFDPNNTLNRQKLLALNLPPPPPPPPPPRTQDISGTVLDAALAVKTVNSDITSSLICGEMNRPLSQHDQLLGPSEKDQYEIKETLTEPSIPLEPLNGSPKKPVPMHTSHQLFDDEGASVCDGALETLETAEAKPVNLAASGSAIAGDEKLSSVDQSIRANAGVDNFERSAMDSAISAQHPDGSVFLKIGCAIVDSLSGAICRISDLADDTKSSLGHTYNSGLSTALNAPSKLSESEQRIWNDWDRRDKEQGTQFNSKTSDEWTYDMAAEDKRREEHQDRRLMARKKLVEHANAAVALSAQDGKSQDEEEENVEGVDKKEENKKDDTETKGVTSDSTSTESTSSTTEGSGADTNSTKTSTAENEGKEAQLSEPKQPTSESLAVSSSKSADDTESASDETPESSSNPGLRPPQTLSLPPDQSTVLEKFACTLRDGGMEVLKLNRHMKWQNRTLTISHETFPLNVHNDTTEQQQVTGGAQVQVSCPKALLWLKRFNPRKNSYGLSNISSDGQGGLEYSQITNIELDCGNDKVAGPPLSKTFKAKFAEPVSVTIECFSVNNSLRNLIFRFKTEDEGRFFAISTMIIMDAARRDRDMKSKKEK